MKIKNFYKNIGKRLKELRLRANMSQEQLAEHVGVATKTISYWENAHNPVTLNKIPLIAEALNVPAYKLFVFFDSEEQSADNDYIKLLQSKTEEELAVLLKLIKEIQKIK